MGNQNYSHKMAKNGNIKAHNFEQCYINYNFDIWKHQLYMNWRNEQYINEIKRKSPVIFRISQKKKNFKKIETFKTLFMSVNIKWLHENVILQTTWKFGLLNSVNSIMI